MNNLSNVFPEFMKLVDLGKFLLKQIVQQRRDSLTKQPPRLPFLQVLCMSD